jgi:hypothetical protein
MEFLQPWMLWGITGVALPIAIHFWYQKKGEVIAWAASRWLVDETSLKHRGVRLYEILLLLIRCLLIILLALLLSAPVLDWWKKEKVSAKIHLVQPDARITSNYRFEIENALKAGEKVLWISPDPAEFESMEAIPQISDSELYIQKTINKAGSGQVSIYLIASRKLLDLPKMYIPGKYTLHTLPDSVTPGPAPFVDLNGGKKLFVNSRSGQLEATADNEDLNFARKPVHSGAFNVLLDYQDKQEKSTVGAALHALEDVYGLTFNITEKSAPDINYDLVFSNRIPERIDDNRLYVISGKTAGLQPAKNLVVVPDSLKINSAELVANARLPEWLGELLVAHFGLDNRTNQISQQQLSSLFEEVRPSQAESAEKFRRWGLLLFVLLTMLERWLALRKTMFSNYA